MPAVQAKITEVGVSDETKENFNILIFYIKPLFIIFALGDLLWHFVKVINEGFWVILVQIDVYAQFPEAQVRREARVLGFVFLTGGLSERKPIHLLLSHDRPECLIHHVLSVVIQG